MKHSFNNTKSKDFDASTTRPGKLKNGWPLGEFFDRGYGFAAVYQQDLVGHNEVSFLGGIHRLFYNQKGQSFPKAHEWGVLSTVAWGGSRAMDYFEQDPDVDAARVAVMGHSKMGKATLWTAAQDERFALAVSAQSGCAGAALWRRKSGETLKKMVTRFPYWLCRNAWKFVEQEDDLPVDQHMLLALRPRHRPRPIHRSWTAALVITSVKVAIQSSHLTGQRLWTSRTVTSSSNSSDQATLPNSAINHGRHSGACRLPTERQA